MAKRKGSLSAVTAFMSEEAQDQIREQAGILAPLPIDTILPDPAQPRQLLAEDLMAALVAGELAPAAALQTWMKRATAAEAPPALKRNVQELRRLADSIAQHGLINPISVRRVPSQLSLPAEMKYLIITGERRYWAHVLLTADSRQIQEGVETSDPSRIKATIASEGVSVRAHQIIENLLREDIDAVEKANGFLALRLELSGVSPDETGRLDRNHGSGLVKWRQVEKALGVSDRYRRYVITVHKLSPAAREIIRQHGLTERLVRPISQKLQQDPELQLRALKRIVAWQQEAAEEDGLDRPITASVERLVDTMLVRAARQPQQVAETAVDPQQLHARIKSALKLLAPLGEPDLLKLAEALAHGEGNTGVVDDANSLQQQLVTLLQAVAAQQQPADE